jgi:hypothetical protein
LRSRRRLAPPGDIIKRHAARPTHFPDPRNHADPRQKRTNVVFALSYTFAVVASIGDSIRRGDGMKTQPRLLAERSIESGIAGEGQGSGIRPVRSVTVNIAESPLGWLFARGFVTQRQFDAGERLRWDWERAQLAPRVTMAWDAAPMARGRSGLAPDSDPRSAQIDAKRRFDAAVASAGPGLADILWRVVCAGDGMREAETALGWPARAGKLVLSFALDRIAAHYRIR